MNVPAIAKKTYEELKGVPEYMVIYNFVLENLRRLTDKYVRAKLIHAVVDEFNNESFSHPLVQELSPCKLGCTACCHTQVSVTDDEAQLLVQLIEDGVEVNRERLSKQAAVGNDSSAFFKLKYQDRKCIFLGVSGACSVYEDRPSVCRTNVVLGDASQCDTSKGIKPTRLVKTPKSDLAIYASFETAELSGTLPYMVDQFLELSENAS